ncbi:MAG: hypothetical protein KGY44_06670 [Halanaerobiales bacterium]|nr:hypothetical protein [Halanaerobiales bacterium]
MKKRYILVFSLMFLLLLAFPIHAQNTMGYDNLEYIDQENDMGSLFKDEKIELNSFRILPILEDIGIVSDPKYYFEREIDFPLGNRYFILKIEEEKGERKYIPVEFSKSGNKNDNDYWIYKADTRIFDAKVEITYQFIKKEYTSDPQINYLELVVFLKSDKNIKSEFKFSNFFLAKQYTRGKGFLYGLSNYDEKLNSYHNMIIKTWSGDIKKAYNVQAHSGEDKYESIEYTMDIERVRSHLSLKCGKLELFYTQQKEPEAAMNYYEDMFY